jgi:hypothetical protein
VNNTFYRFAKGANWSPRGGHHRYLGNVWDDISQTVFTLGRLKEDTSAAAQEYPHELMGFAGNVFYDVGKLGHFENLVPEEEKMHESFESFQAALQKRQALAASLGVKAQRPPLRDPAGRDMRPSDGSAAIDQGVKFFVPWALYGMVGEWNFYPLGNDPSTIPDEHWYMTDYYRNRATYHTMPQYPLSVVNATEDSYMEGPLEDWARGALRFNGTDRYAFIEHEAMSKPVEYQVREGRGRRARTRRVEAAAADLKNPDIHKTNFLLEVYFRTEPGHAGGTLARKMDGAGYSLSVDDSGRVHFVVSGGGKTFALTSQSVVNDGEWHHVIAECDREDREMRIYVDGKLDSTGDGAGPDANLSNAGDFLVGGTPEGEYLAGAIDFLRVCHGTLADARTTIDELYTWQFDGPFLRDFTGRKPQGDRDAGAIEGGSQ